MPKKTEERGRKMTKNGRYALSEAESKKVLAKYGVPTVPEAKVSTLAEAVAESKRLGFPVVVKGEGAKLTHKTELGVVKLNLQSEQEVLEACQDIEKRAGDKLEGYLIQPMVKGQREFVCGMFRDAQFGPVVMFGLGGIFTEALGDVAFRIAPLTRNDALQMMEQIKSKKLLGAFRGEAEANKDDLAAALLGLSQLAIGDPTISEIDINPLIVQPDGHAMAVDALIVKNENDAEKNAAVVNMDFSEDHIDRMNKGLASMFAPESIAVVGASMHTKSGTDLASNIARNGYSGRLYRINPKATEDTVINGNKFYPDLNAIPETVDLVIVNVNRKLVPGVLKECGKTGNRNIHIFSAGFKESGDEEGIRLQQEIQQVADEYTLNVIGPNCMGFYNPAIKLCTWPSDHSLVGGGDISFVSQSGGNSKDYTDYVGIKYQLNVNKVVSYGNALSVDSTDILEYFGKDDSSKLILQYLEGTKYTRRMLKQYQEISKKKPIILFKAGLSEAGAKAAASHTGALAGSNKVWEAFFQQTGAVQVSSVEELAEVSLSFDYLPETKGNRLGIIGSGGGVSVAIADTCEKMGVATPILRDELKDKMKEYLPVSGTIFNNPIDSSECFFNPELLIKTLGLMAQEDYLDMFAININLDWFILSPDLGIKVAEIIATQGKVAVNGKPLVVTYRQFSDDVELRKKIGNIMADAKIPFYAGLPIAVNALSKFAKYCEFKRANR